MVAKTGHMFSVLSLCRYRSQKRPNTCVGVAFTRHDQVHMYLYNIYRPIYRPLYLHIYYIVLALLFSMHQDEDARPVKFSWVKPLVMY